jgi:hypothetical protein
MAVPSPAVSGNGRYFVDTANGSIPFRIHGEASWDAHINLSQTDWRAYLDDRKAKGFTVLYTYVCSSVPYWSASNAPALQTGELPFLKNTSGTTWTGVFGNHDADFSTPNDAYFSKVAGFVDDAGARGITIAFAFCYSGFNQGAADGWLTTVTNSANTTGVCNAFGAYLANGHGAFTGFASRSNIIWICGGDTLPTNGGTGALRSLEILKGLQANGCNQPVSYHWQRNYKQDQTDFASRITARSLYSQPVMYAMGRSLYPDGQPMISPENWYFGEHSVTRAISRYESWAASITSQCGGCMNALTPLWGFATSVDGVTGSLATCWQASFTYLINTIVNHSGNWYQCVAAGTSAGSGGPTGTGSGIVDGGVTWNWLCAVSGTIGGMANLLSHVATLDHAQVGNFLATVPWWRLIPENLGAMGTIITSGQGTAASYSDTNPPSGGTDWIVSSAADDKSCLLAYVPDPHSGSFGVDMTKLGSNASAYWIDPTNGQRTFIASLVSVGSHTFTVPGANAGGDNDWVLLVQATPTALSRWLVADGIR